MIQLKHWDEKNQKLKNGRQNAALINSFLDGAKSKLNKLFVVASDKVINVNYLKSQFQGKKKLDQNSKQLWMYSITTITECKRR